MNVRQFAALLAVLEEIKDSITELHDKIDSLEITEEIEVKPDFLI